MAFSKKHIIIGLHVLGWLLLAFIFLFYIPLVWNVKLPGFFITWQLILFFMLILLFYTNARYIIPNTILKGKQTLFILWIALIITGTQLAALGYTALTDMHARMALLVGKTNDPYHIWDRYVFTMTVLILGISTSWALLEYRRHAEQKRQKLEEDKTKMELTVLKTQINPHFFFNSLNSVYSLTYIDVDDARKALLTLGNMMRYLLYNTEEGNTTLLKEVDFLRNYITLMKLRATENVKIELDIPDKLNDYVISTMLLLPFLENAFKHGVDTIEKTVISIKLKQDKSFLFFSVINCTFTKNNDDNYAGGLGLTNTKRRLELLYPQKHILHTGINENGKYEVNLQIDLEYDNNKMHSHR